MRKLMLFALSFSLALGLTVLVLPRPWPLILAGVFGLLGIGALLLRDKRLRALAICTLAACIGFLWCSGYDAFFYGIAEKYDQKELEVQALVLDAPMESRYGASVTTEIRLNGRPFQTVLYLDKTFMDLNPGDTVVCTAKLKLTPGRIRDDDNHYYRSRGVWFTASQRGDATVRRAESIHLRHVSSLFSLRLQEALYRIFPEDTSGFLVAILTGDRAGLDFATRNQLSITGIYHTVAVSGMHVSILIGIIVLLCGARRRLAAAIGIPVVIFFVLMTGAPASAVRAGIMQSFLLLAPLLDRENDPFTSLSTALMFLLAVDPWSIYNVGLQLSFASVAGILLFAGRLYEMVSSWGFVKKLLKKVGRVRWLVQTMLSSFCSSIACIAFSLPLAAYYFGNVSVVSPLVNVLSLWTVTICFTLGILIGLLGLLWWPLAVAPAWLLSWLVRYVLGTARLFAQIPFAAVYTNSVYMTAWAALCYGTVLFCLISPRKPGKLTTAACMAGSLLLCILMAWGDYHHPAFSFTALDVGQGQCLIYRCGSFSAVIDCGGSSPDQAGEDAARFLQSAGKTGVDVLVLTHYDLDHAGGAMQLLERVQVDTVYLPDTEDPNGLKEAVLQKARETGATVQMVQEDLTLHHSGGTLALFAPMSQRSSNEAGVCVLASAGDYDMLVTGDLTAELEYQLIQEQKLPDVELLVAGHHGSETSTSYALLNRTRPETVLISVREDSPYGHPAPETLERLALFGATVYRTDQCGTITIRGN